jgi:hypothetical protein
MSQPEVQIDETPRVLADGERVELRRIVSMENPFKAFQVILQNADEDYIKKLGGLLGNVTEVMKK